MCLELEQVVDVHTTMYFKFDSEPCGLHRHVHLSKDIIFHVLLTLRKVARDDLISPTAFGLLDATQRRYINELLHWVKSHEMNNAAKEKNVVLNMKDKVAKPKQHRDYKHEYQLRKCSNAKRRRRS